MHHRLVERVVMDNILGCPLFWGAQETALVSAVQKVSACVLCLSSNCSSRVLAVRSGLS